MLCPYKFGYYEFEGGQDCIGIECGMHKLCNADNEITAVEFDALDEHAQALERENEELRKLCGANDILAAENDVSAKSVDTNDSHAKLEEDWTEFYTTHERECLYQSDVGQFVFDLLDRQAAITERQQREWWADVVAELTAERDGLYNDLEKAVSRTDKLIRRLEDDYGITASWGGLLNVWQIENDEHDLLEQVHAKCTELQKKVDELTAKCDQWRVAAGDTHDMWEKADTERCKLRKHVDELTADLAAARNAHAQAEHEAVILREKLGRMLDCSHEIERIGQI